jgi:hypothetical protein
MQGTRPKQWFLFKRVKFDNGDHKRLLLFNIATGVVEEILQVRLKGRLGVKRLPYEQFASWSPIKENEAYQFYHYLTY